MDRTGSARRGWMSVGHHDMRVRINKIKDGKNCLEFVESQNCCCLLPWWGEFGNPM